MIITEDIGQQEEIRKIEIPSFYANKRIIGISTIIQELPKNYLNRNAIWSYYSRDQFMIYSNSRELRKANMDEYICAFREYYYKGPYNTEEGITDTLGARMKFLQR
ncbi:hypothetical protein H5410_050445 [Solanum commersonii]|uniref:Uncharacterized protein n=1 Tax=Solanum commersonii TaxID=4109 RepID=A0A9J5WVJ1_SOLCO|nr:hypothetical protein H5410_050445 [Solanum commersonii]